MEKCKNYSRKPKKNKKIGRNIELNRYNEQNIYKIL